MKDDGFELKVTSSTDRATVEPVLNDDDKLVKEIAEADKVISSWHTSGDDKVWDTLTETTSMMAQLAEIMDKCHIDIITLANKMDKVEGGLEQLRFRIKRLEDATIGDVTNDIIN
jgi:GTP-binding protein EngB required for normal cell division|tara:strand:+ start:1226 stop:1570 length:345 start_codon:yes stop_codon:yes gene_type:complete